MSSYNKDNAFDKFCKEYPKFKRMVDRSEKLKVKKEKEIYKRKLESGERIFQMLSMRKDLNMSLRKIGKVYSISGERVRQVIELLCQYKKK